MRLTLRHIITCACIFFGFAYYFIPFVRYLLIPFNGNSQAPESLMVRFLEINTALDVQNQESICSDADQPIESSDKRLE